MAPSLLLLAASITVVFPPFEVDRAPGVLSQRIPQAYVAAIEGAKCASPTPPSKLGPQTLADFAECADRNSCLGDIGRLLGADLVVRGQIEKLDSSYLIRLTVFDVRAYAVRKYVEQRYDGKLTGLAGAVKGQIPELCKVLNPDWKDPSAIDSLASLSFEAPTGAAPAAPPPATASKPPPPPVPPLAASLTFDPPVLTPPAAAPASVRAAPAASAAPAESTGFDDLPPMLDDAPAPAPPKPAMAVVVEPMQATPPVATPPSVATPSTPPVQLSPSVAKAGPAGDSAPKVVDLTPEPVPTRNLPPAATRPAVRSRPLPWGAIMAGGALSLGITGAVFGVMSHSVWSNDHVTMVDGVPQHSISYTDALRGNRLAGTADILFAVAAAAGVGAGVLIYTQGGLGVGGHF